MTRNRSIVPGSGRLRLGAATAALAFALSLSSALALSELQREDVPVPEGADDVIREQLPPPAAGESSQSEEAEPQPSRPLIQPVPMPDPVVAPQPPPPADAEEGEDEEELAIPEIRYDVSTLPEPVRRMRDLIMEACLSGDVERLRPLLSGGPDGTQLSFGGLTGDPIEFLRSVSGDGEGHEILAILYEVMAAGFVLDQTEVGDMYIWPYFFAVPLDSLTPPQRVELFKLVTAGDYEDMKNYGAYIFYRAGITPEGRWQFFVAGD